MKPLSPPGLGDERGLGHWEQPGAAEAGIGITAGEKGLGDKRKRKKELGNNWRGKGVGE